jgi:hypothetical protein
MQSAKRKKDDNTNKKVKRAKFCDTVYKYACRESRENAMLVLFDEWKQLVENLKTYNPQRKKVYMLEALEKFVFTSCNRTLSCAQEV